MKERKESICRNCFHYKACKEVASHSGYSDIDYTESQCKYFTPTDDVVPKSEVARLQSQVYRLKKYDEERDIALHARLIAETREKAASEIFAEIETLLALNILVGDVFTGKYFDADLENDIAELKKKYTEGNQ